MVLREIFSGKMEQLTGGWSQWRTEGVVWGEFNNPLEFPKI